MDVLEHLLLDDLEFINDLRIVQIDLRIGRHVEHFLSRPSKVHIHHSNQVLLSKLDFLDSDLVDFGLFNLTKLLGHPVILNVALYNGLQSVNLRVVLKIVFNVERKLLNLLVNENVDFFVNLLHL